jgi:LPPG:FO 2-phospho-L-lactate transferase
MVSTSPKILALSGGVGGAKLALGLAQVVPSDALTVVVNTGDDFEHLGLKVCPDLDTLMYTLSGLANQTLGWGQQDETWQFLDALKRLGGDTWFGLGDRDLATHVHRTALLAQGDSLSAVTAGLMRSLGVLTQVVPMTDDSVATLIHCQNGETLSFQHYFVRDRCEPLIKGISFQGIETARRAPEFEQLIAYGDLSQIIICPSNPFVSVAPILDLAETWKALKAADCPVVLVSPIVAGMALKGPAAKMMTELKMPSTALAVAQFYADTYPGLVDGFVLDEADAVSAEAVSALGLTPLVTQTVMRNLNDKQALAEAVLRFSNELSSR